MVFKIDLENKWPEPPSVEYAAYCAARNLEQSRNMVKKLKANKRLRSYWNGEANAYEVMLGVLIEAIQHKETKND